MLTYRPKARTSPTIERQYWRVRPVRNQPKSMEREREGGAVEERNRFSRGPLEGNQPDPALNPVKA
jgi:hypothetical protein